MKIAILGAPGSGKTQLADALSRRLPPEPPHATATLKVCVLDIAARLRQPDFDVTLVCGLDLISGPGQTAAERASREAMDTQLRAALQAAQIPFSVIYGHGPARLEAALQALATRQPKPAGAGGDATPAPRWHWTCDKCSDPVCEHQLFSRLIKPS